VGKSDTKLPQQLAKNASKLHKRVGKLISCKESPYSNYEIRQEVRVSDINPDYKSNREKFDWVILGLKVVIEIHGEQHYSPVCFGGMDIEKAKRVFLQRLRLDEKKQTAAKEAKWAYVVVKYTEKNITLEELVDKISDALEEVEEGIYQDNKLKAKIQSRGFQKHEGEYKWPTRKIQSRPFQKHGKTQSGKT